VRLLIAVLIVTELTLFVDRIVGFSDNTGEDEGSHRSVLISLIKPATGLAFCFGVEVDAGLCRDVVAAVFGFEESAEVATLFMAAIPAADCAAGFDGVLAGVEVTHVCDSGIR